MPRGTNAGTGAGKFSIRLKELEAKAVGFLFQALEEAAEKVVAPEQRRQAPVLSGDLKDSIRVKVHSKQPDVLRLNVRPGVRYWHLPEFGHIQTASKGGAAIGHVPAYPYIRPSSEVSFPVAKKVIRARMKQLLRGLR